MKRILLAAAIAAVSGVAVSQAFREEPLKPIRPPQNINLGMVELGKKLYFDPRLSKSGFISCTFFFVIYFFPCVKIFYCMSY